MIAQYSTHVDSPRLSIDSTMDSSQQIRSFIRRQNASHQVVVWSTSDGPCCAATVKLLRTKAKDVVVHQLDSQQYGHQIENELCMMIGQEASLMVFANSRYIGRCDSIRQANLSGRLRQLLKSSPRPQLRRSSAHYRHTRDKTEEKLAPSQRNVVWEKEEVAITRPESNYAMFRKALRIRGSPRSVVIQDLRSMTLEPREVEEVNIGKSGIQTGYGSLKEGQRTPS
jgi:hypothetical protein